MSSLLSETVEAVRIECQRQMRVSGLPQSILDSISDTETGNLFKGHPLTLTALPLVAYEAVSGRPAGDVVSAGAAMEFLLTAGDILDDLQDGAHQAHDLSGPGAVLFSTRQAELVVALLLLSEQAMLSFDGSLIPYERAAQAAKLFCDLKVKAFAGQVDEVHEIEPGPDDPAHSLEVVQKKSGNLGKAAGAIGAALGTSDISRMQLAAEFGERLGIICQLNNDIADLWPTGGKLEDLAAGKSTLPVAFANALGGAPLSGVSNGAPDLSAVRDHVFESGGIHFTYVHIAVQLVKAGGIARQIEQTNPRSRLSELLEIR